MIGWPVSGEDIEEFPSVTCVCTVPTAISALPLKCRLSNAANLYSPVKHFTGLGGCTQLTMYVLFQGYCIWVLGCGV